MNPRIQTAVLHNGGLTSGLLVAMAARMYSPEEIALISYRNASDRRFQAVRQLAEYYGIETVYQRNIVRPLDRRAEKLVMIIESTDTMRRRFPNAKSLVFGEHNKVSMRTSYARMELWSNTISDLHNDAITLHTPFLELKETDIILKTVDYELPLDLVRDCVASTDLFCGECYPCRVRINAFREVGFMDWEYEQEIDFNLPPADMKDYVKFQSEEE